MDTHTGLIARTSEDSLRDSDDARVDDLISRQLQSEVDVSAGQRVLMACTSSLTI